MRPADRPIGGFNLLPWRRREAGRVRRRAALEWLAAVLLGCACATPFAGWQLWQRTRFDAERRALDQPLARLRAPLAEERRLLHEADERRSLAFEAQQQAKPLVHLFLLLDELAAAKVEGVSLHQIVHRAHETGLQATVGGEAVTAAWLARLRTLPDVETVSVREMKRAAANGGGRPGERQRGPLRVTAQLAWAGGSQPVALQPAASQPRAGKPHRRSGE